MITFLVTYSVLILVIELLAYFLYTIFGGKRRIHYVLFFIPILIFVFLEVKWENNRKDELLKMERKRIDSLRNVYIKDSIEHDPRHQDSLRRAKRIYNEYKQKERYYEAREIVGYVYGNDTIYHSNFHWIHEIPDEYFDISTNHLIDEIENLRFVSREQAENEGLKECEECEEINRVYRNYEDGDLIDRDDIRDYNEDDY